MNVLVWQPEHPPGNSWASQSDVGEVPPSVGGDAAVEIGGDAVVKVGGDAAAETGDDTCTDAAVKVGGAAAVETDDGIWERQLDLDYSAWNLGAFDSHHS